VKTYLSVIGEMEINEICFVHEENEDPTAFFDAIWITQQYGVDDKCRGRWKTHHDGGDSAKARTIDTDVEYTMGSLGLL
jgi:hypothetical protein